MEILEKAFAEVIGTVTMNYENVLNMVRQRSKHKLPEWSESFMDWAKSLPYAEELFFTA